MAMLDDNLVFSSKQVIPGDSTSTEVASTRIVDLSVTGRPMGRGIPLYVVCAATTDVGGTTGTFKIRLYTSDAITGTGATAAIGGVLADGTTDTPVLVEELNFAADEEAGAQRHFNLQDSAKRYYQIRYVSNADGAASDGSDDTTVTTYISTEPLTTTGIVNASFVGFKSLSGGGYGADT